MPVTTDRRFRALLVTLAMLSTCWLAMGCGGSSSRSETRRSTVLVTTPWLGMNYNSGRFVHGALRAFSSRGIVYDRDGSLEVRAGATVDSDPLFGQGLARSYSAGMIPDVVVDSADGPSGCTNPDQSGLCLPVTPVDQSAYVRGFIETTRSVLRAHPGKEVLFEPMNEPWNLASPPGTSPGRVAARQYAAVLRPLLTATARAHVPLRDIYVPATGQLEDGSSWISDLYQDQPCLLPGRNTCGPIAGWNLHPYGVPDSQDQGIGSVPGIRQQMRSGQDNVVVSEIGFCATDVADAEGCSDNTSDLATPGDIAAARLSATLEQAAAMHREGWLRALIVWERQGGGWGMQNPDGTLTAQGLALKQFATSAAAR
jgi:hypothetical protein